MRWDALPPTLVTTCETSDDKGNVGRSWEVKVLRLDEEVLEYQLAKENPVRYERVDAGADARRLLGVWRVVKEEEPDANRERWVAVAVRDATFTFTDGHVALANTGTHPGYRLTLDERQKTLVMQSDNRIGLLLVYHGRYRLDGDRLVVCVGGELPGDFTPKAPAARLYHLERAALDLRDADGKVLIAADEITAYEWGTHTLTLAPTAAARLRKLLHDERRLDKPFAVAVGGKAVYSGQLVSVLSSRSYTGVVVSAALPKTDPAGADRFPIHYSAGPAGKDPRGDATVRAVLAASEKLR